MAAPRLGGTGHTGWVAGRMPDGMNDDFGLRSFVENEIGVGRHSYSTDRRIGRAAAHVRVEEQKIGERLDPGQNPPRALR